MCFAITAAAFFSRRAEALETVFDTRMSEDLGDGNSGTRTSQDPGDGKSGASRPENPEDRLRGTLILENPEDGTRYAGYEAQTGDEFSVEFVHSVNKSTVRDCFEIREDGIYGIKTIYYGFGAGVLTELEDGQELTYGPDGGMIVSGFDVLLDNLIYRVGTVSDHILTLQDGSEVSLRDLCGRSARVRFRFEPEDSGGSSVVPRGKSE